MNDGDGDGAKWTGSSAALQMSPYTCKRPWGVREGFMRVHCLIPSSVATSTVYERFQEVAQSRTQSLDSLPPWSLSSFLYVLNLSLTFIAAFLGQL